MTTTNAAPGSAAPIAEGQARSGAESRGPRRPASSNRSVDRLPGPPRQRRPALAALAVLLIVGGAALAGLLALRMDERVPVLVAGRDVPVGQRIAREDLAVGRVAGEGVAMISADDADQVVGQYATRTVRAGQLLDGSMVDRVGFLQPGMTAVGVPMLPGRVPAKGLEVGDVVRVLRVPEEGEGRVLVDEAVVSQSTTAGDREDDERTQGVDQAATVMVQDGQVGDVASAAAAGQVTLVLLRRDATTRTDR
ncbi:MAG: SAF domain-containing protein [Angustibacter sp.]